MLKAIYLCRRTGASPRTWPCPHPTPQWTHHPMSPARSQGHQLNSPVRSQVALVQETLGQRHRSNGTNNLNISSHTSPSFSANISNNPVDIETRETGNHTVHSISSEIRSLNSLLNSPARMPAYTASPVRNVSQSGEHLGSSSHSIDKPKDSNKPQVIGDSDFSSKSGKGQQKLYSNEQSKDLEHKEDSEIKMAAKELVKNVIGSLTDRTESEAGSLGNMTESEAGSLGNRTESEAGSLGNSSADDSIGAGESVSLCDTNRARDLQQQSDKNASFV